MLYAMLPAVSTLRKPGARRLLVDQPGRQLAIVPDSSSYTVIYDGNCVVCSRIVERLRKWDRGMVLTIVPAQEPGVQARFPWIPESSYRQSMQVVAVDGRTWQGAAGIEQLLTVLPRGRWIAWIFHIPFVRAIAEACYRWFARNRYRLGCGEHCQLKSENAQIR